MLISGIHIYPVKSCAPVDLRACEVEPWGLRADRRWMVVDAAGETVTARTDRRLLTIRPQVLDGGGLRLCAPEQADLVVRPDPDGAPVPVELSRLESALAVGPEADAWFSGVLGRAVRLLWLDDPRRRHVGPKHGGTVDDPVNLADTCPLLVTTEASLRQLNAWIAQSADDRGEDAPGELAMTRFRPNIVLGGDLEPFSEDRWRRFALGELTFRAAELCDRCVLTTIDPVSLAGGKEPIRTLARYRRWDGATWFGLRAIPETVGTIEVGQTLQVL